MFRFEYHQNFVTKHHLGSSQKLSWDQAAAYAWNKDANKATICRVEQTSPDEISILKRYDKRHGRLYNWFNFESLGHYERVIINRAEKTIAIDRIDE